MSALVACSDAAGPEAEGGRSAVVVRTATSGESIDIDGYTVALGGQSLDVPVNGSVRFEDVPSGGQLVELNGVAPNCRIEGGSRVTVSVSAAGVSETEFGIECDFELSGIALLEVPCPALAPAAARGLPFDLIPLGAPPTDFTGPIMARISWEGGSGVTLGYVEDEAPKPLGMWVPIHPSGTADGGAVTVRIADETRTCPPFAFVIDPLPAASGELAAVVDLAQALIASRAELFATSVDELKTKRPAELHPAVLPLAIAQRLIDHPENETSLRRQVNGTASGLTAADPSLLDRTIARLGFRADFEAALPAQPVGLPATASFQASGGPTAGLALACVLGIEDAQELHDCMTLGRDKIQGTASKATQGKATFLMGTAAAIPGPTKPLATAVDALLTISELYDQAVAGALPTEFASIFVLPKPNGFLEDSPGTGSWVPAEVRARSTGWTMDKLVWEVLAKGVEGSDKFKAWMEKAGEYGAKSAGIKGIEPGELESFYGDFLAHILKQVTEMLGGLTPDFLTYGPDTWGPIDISDPKWSESRIVTGTSVELTSHTDYAPREPGISLLEVITAEGMFGGTNIATDPFRPIQVAQIEMEFLHDGAPVSEIFLGLGEVAELELRVRDSASPDSVAISLAQGGGSSGAPTYEGGGIHRLTYTAPQTPAGFPALLVADHTAKSGARAGDAAPRVAQLVIQPRGVQIFPGSGVCVAPGATQQYTADVIGLDNKTVEWSTDVGSISSSGLYTAPNGAPIGTVATITAESVIVEGLKATVQVMIGCVCGFQVDVGGTSYQSAPGDQASFMPDVTRQDGIIWVQLTSAATGRDVLFTMGGVPTVPGVYEVADIGGELAYGTDLGYSLLGQDDAWFDLVAYEPGTRLEGQITGTVRDAVQGSAGPAIPISASFRIDPPLQASFLGYYCEVPAP